MIWSCSKEGNTYYIMHGSHDLDIESIWAQTSISSNQWPRGEIILEIWEVSYHKDQTQ